MEDLLVHYPVQAAKNTYIYIDIVVCHPVKDVVGEVLPGLILTEHDEEGEESGECRDDAEHGDHLYRHSVRQGKVTDISH